VPISNTTSISENVDGVEFIEFDVVCTCDDVNVIKIVVGEPDDNNLPIQEDFLFKISK